MIGRVGICGAAAATLMVAGFAGGALADPKGVWLNEAQDSHVKIYACEDDDDELCGEIVWLKNPLGKDGKPRRDVKSEDKSLRDRQVMGLQIITGMEDEGGGEWEDGEIYNPRGRGDLRRRNGGGRRQHAQGERLRVVPLQDTDLDAGGIIGRLRHPGSM